MYISSYATYIPTTTKTRVDTKREDTSLPKEADFSLNSLEKSSSETEIKSPIKKISQYPLFGETQENETLNTFKKLKKTEGAQNAYKQNTQPYSFMQLSKAKPAVGKTQTPQEDILKIKSVNTYIENDNYYKITAA